VDDGLGDADALLESFGKVSNQAPTGVGQAAALFGPGSGGFALSRREAPQACAVAQIFINREFALQRRLFRQVAEQRLGWFGLVQYIDSTDKYLPGRGRQCPADHLHGGGLAGAVGPEKAQDLAPLKLEVDTAYGVCRAVEFV